MTTCHVADLLGVIGLILAMSPHRYAKGYWPLWLVLQR
jgi:hypothetical protein